MISPKNSKPIYSMLHNVIFMLKIQYNYSKFSVFLYILSIFIFTGLTFLEICLPQVVVNCATNNVTPYEVLLYIGSIGIAIIILNMLNQWINTYGSFLLNRVTIGLTSRKTQKVVNTDYENIESQHCRDIMQKADEAIWGTGEGSGAERMIKNIYSFFSNLICFILFGSFLFFVNPWLTILLTILPMINHFMLIKIQRFQYSSHDYTSSLDRKLWYIANHCGSFDGAKDVRIYGMNQWLVDIYRSLTKERLSWSRKFAWKFFRANILEAVLLIIRDGLAYILLIAMVLNGEIPLGNFVFCFTAIGSFAGWVGGILNKVSAINRASLSICDLREFLEYPEKNNRGSTSVAATSANIEKGYCVDFENMSFRYKEAEADTLKNINIHIKGGEKIAIVGLNGAGKTTLIKCLCGLYSCSSGNIKVNGINKEDYNIYDYYRMFGTVFQDFYFLPVSIAEAVSGKDKDNTNFQRVKECLEMAGLMEKISTLDDGVYSMLNKQINEDGIDLSGGEKQKLLLARALYKDAPILILDEPTAALDPIAENKMYEHYHILTQKKTSFFISHRLSSTRFCDRILYMENGEIIEMGSHEELMRLGGKYAELFELQSRYYKTEVNISEPTER